jgi:hypothetical protein
MVSAQGATSTRSAQLHDRIAEGHFSPRDVLFRQIGDQFGFKRFAVPVVGTHE